MIDAKRLVASAAAFVLACAHVAIAAGPAPDPYANAPRDVFELADYDYGELSASTRAGFICNFGGRNSRYPSPAYACIDAYEEAFTARHFDAAARYALYGCARHKDAGSCRRLASLPIAIGNSGRAVRPSVAHNVREAASAICGSPGSLVDSFGRDITGRECAHLARRFVLARDPEYRFAFAPAAARFFESIYEPQRAARHYEAACQRLREPAVCADAARLIAGAAQR